MKTVKMLTIVALFSGVVAHAQGTDEFTSGSETVVKEKKIKNADGSEETIIRSGNVKPRREGGPRVGEIYQEDQSRVVSRVETLALWSFNFGPGGGSNVGNSNMFYNVSVGRHWEVNPNAEIRAIGDVNMASANKGSVTSLTMGGSWLTSTSDISPLIGADFGYGIATGEGRDTMSGFALGAHAGVRLFRTAKTQMSVEANMRTILVKDDKPVFYGLQLGILF